MTAGVVVPETIGRAVQALGRGAAQRMVAVRRFFRDMQASWPPEPRDLTSWKALLLTSGLKTNTVRRYLASVHQVVLRTHPEDDWSWMAPVYGGLTAKGTRQRRCAVKRRYGVRSTPVPEWPSDLRIGWQAALGGMEGADGAAYLRRVRGREGNRSRVDRLSPGSRANIQNKIGIFVSILRRDGVEPTASEAAVDRFIELAQPHYRLLTLWGYVHALHRGFIRIFPDDDFCWLRQTLSVLKSAAEGQGTIRLQKHVASLADLRALGIRLMNDAAASPLTKDAAVRFRNGLIIAFLSDEPLRRADLNGLQIEWRQRLGADEPRLTFRQAKNGEPVAVRPEDDVLDGLHRWIRVYRPVLATDASGTALWLAKNGDPLSPHTITWALRKVTREELGRPIPPHAFRTNVAIALLQTCLGMPEIISGKLRHKSSASMAVYVGPHLQIAAGRLLRDARRALTAGEKPGRRDCRPVG